MYKYKTVKFVCGIDAVKKMQNLQNSPFFDRVKVYEGGVSAIVLMRKMKVTLDKPRYVGMCILSISKEIMYDYHYNFILKHFPGIFVNI